MTAQAHLSVHTGLKLSRLALQVWTLVLIMDGGKGGGRGEGCNINIPHPTHLCYGGVVGGGENTSVTLKQPTAKFTAWHWRCGPLYSGWGVGAGGGGGGGGEKGRGEGGSGRHGASRFTTPPMYAREIEKRVFFAFVFLSFAGRGHTHTPIKAITASP